VWCEKPLVEDAREAAIITAAFEKGGILLAVNYQRRWDYRMERIKNMLRSGTLGCIQKIVIYYSKGLRHSGSHAVDLIMDWLGPCSGAETFGRGIMDYSWDDPTVDARFIAGGVPVYLIGLDNRKYGMFEINIFSERGRIVVENYGEKVVLYRARGRKASGSAVELGKEIVMKKKAGFSLMEKVLDEIVRAIRTGSPIRSTGRTALQTVEACCTILGSRKACGFARGKPEDRD